MKRALLLIALLCALLSAPQVVKAEEKKSSCLQAIEFLSGFGKAGLVRQDDYNVIPFFFSFDFNLKQITQKFNFNPQQLLQLQAEPFISYVSSPHNNIETGANFFLKIGLLPETSKLQPFIKAGAGLIYLTEHVHYQSTQCNFTETAGAGLHYFLTRNIGLTLEYRFRHLSNCGIKEPNHGINTQFGLAGLTYRF